LNGADIADFKLIEYLFEMSAMNMQLKKFDDAERNIAEAEKILKKIPKTDPEYKKWEGEV
jgi:hypothetical protein